MGATVFDQPLSLDPTKQPNLRTVLIDVRDGGQGAKIEMPLKFWVTVEDKNVGTDPVNALEIKIRYAYQLPEVMGGKWIEKQVQAIRARM